MQTKQSEEPRALSLQEMEETNGGHSVKKEIVCGGLHILAIAGLAGGFLTGGAGYFIGAASDLLAAYAFDCYSPTY